MNKIYDNPAYKKLKAIYYDVLVALFGKAGVPITINGYKFRFSPRHYKWFPENYERENFDMIRRYLAEGSVCVDIGAHFGLYAVVLAKYYDCRVYAFEPTPYSARTACC